MERTINGKPIREVFEKLRRDIPNVIKFTDNKDYPYLEVGVMRNYFDECISISNYDFIIDNVHLYQTASEARACVVARIVLHDDAGNKICEKSYTGTSEAKKSRETGELLDIPGTITNATVDARKNCIRLFGCGERQLSEAMRQKKQRSSGYGAGSGRVERKPAVKENKEAYRRLPQEGMLEYGNIAVRVVFDRNRRTNKYDKFFIMPVILSDFRKETSLIIWKDKHANAEEVVQFLENASRAVTCAGTYEEYRNGTRLVFDHFAERDKG